MITIFGELQPDINKKYLQDQVFLALIHTNSRLTGAQLRFARQKMGLTQAKLALKLSVANHSSVSQWESKGDEITGMELSSEKLLKLQMALFLDDSELIREVADKKILKSSTQAKVKVQKAA
jgi:transcriptional regulator with XRE-family HTH domain